MASKTLTYNSSGVSNVLRQGGIIGYPTESVYGLGCNPFCERAVLEIFRLKQRSVAQGFLLIGANWEHIAGFIDFQQIPDERLRVIEAHWPGPYTWVFPASSRVPRWLVGKHSGIALRLTAHPAAAAICDSFEGAIVSTSANPHGSPPARSAEALRAYFPTELAAIVEEPLGGIAQPTPIRDALTGASLRQ